MGWNWIDDYTGDRIIQYGDKTFDMDNLKLDQHYFTVSTRDSNINIDNVFVHIRDKECYECPYLFLDKSEVNMLETNREFLIATKQMEYFPENFQDGVICKLDPNFGQFGIYDIQVTSEGCKVETLKEPVNIYFPIFTVMILQVLVFGALYCLIKFWYKWKKKQSTNENTEPLVKKQRIMSLDTFRGLSIVIMIFSNYGYGGYAFLRHAIWNGLRVTDLVFPWFMWIMGVCVPISLNSSFKKDVPNKDIMLNVAKRSIKMFLVGIFLDAGSNLYYLRIFGVLQRFGVAYFVVSAICVFLMDRDLTVRANKSIWRFVEDISKVWKGWIIALGLLTFHTVLIFTVAEPGCPRGYLGPGGLYMNRSHPNCVGGATGYIDRLILGIHVYQFPTTYKVYEAKPFDPEGIVGCLTTIFQVFIGVQAGITMLVYKNHTQRLMRWLGWSVILGLLSGILCGFSRENGFIPVNKNLWSVSFVFVTSSFAFALLSICYFLIDVKSWWNGKPLIFAGMNAILMYIGHEMTDTHFPVRWFYYTGSDGVYRRTHFLALLSDIWAADFWVLVAYYLNKIEYFFVI